MRSAYSFLNRTTLLACLLLAIGCLPAAAQVDYATATLKGTVVDPQGAVISGATVTATNPGTGIAKTTKSGGDGGYQILALPPGTYEVAIEAQGFGKEIVKGLVLSVGQSAVFDAHLKISAAGEVTEVGGDTAPLIQTEQTQQANTINALQVEDLPNINRKFTQGAYTLPGVSSADAPRSQQPGFTPHLTTGFSIGGSNGRNVLSTIDGGENESGTGQYRVKNLPLDSVQEYQVNRNAYNAEFGFTGGSAIHIVTKSGGNAWHGDALGYYRNQSTEAANYFSNLEGFNRATSQNAYIGGSLGGPIVTGKLFFFTSYEFQRVDTPFFNPVLNTPEVQGIGAPGLGVNCPAQFTAATPDQVCYVNALKTSGNPFLVGFANGITPGLTPLNNPALNTIIRRDNGLFDNPDRLHNAIMRFDYQPTPQDSVTLRAGYAHNNFTSAQEGITNGTPDSYLLGVRDFNILSTWTRAIHPGLLNQAVVQIVPRDRWDEAPLHFNGVNFTLGSLGAPGPGGTSTFGSPALLPYLAHQQRYQFEDNLTWTKGAHTFKFGASYRPANYHIENDLWFNPQFDFKDGAVPLISLAPAAVQAQLVAFNLTHGLPATGPVSTNLDAAQSFAFGIPVDVIAGFNNPKWQGWEHYFGGYMQDTWKLNSRLTMNAGVRLDFDGEPSPVGSSFYAAPRLGFAWDPFGDHKTVIRAGGGLFVAPTDVLIPSYGSLLNGSGQYINEVYSALTPTNPKVAQLWGLGVALGELPFGRLTPANYASVGLNTTTPGAAIGNSVSPNYKNSYTVQGSLSAERQLAKDLSFELGYNMYHGVHLQMPVETAYQQIAPGSPFCPNPACTDVSGGPFYAPLTTQVQHTTYSSIGGSTYHGLTASLNKRYSSGFQFQANYTWSKAIDNVVDFSGLQNWFRPSRLNLFRAVSAFDVPHIFVANAVYTMPFKAGQGPVSAILADISLSPILTLQSGLPFSVRTPSLNNKSNGQSFDNNFAMPFLSSRDNNRGPAFYTLDLSLQKAFAFPHSRGIHLNVIVEGTNLLNHVNFDHVNDVFDNVNGFSSAVPLPNGKTLNLLTGPYTGLHGAAPVNLSQLTQPLFYSHAAAPRQIQFGLKLGF